MKPVLTAIFVELCYNQKNAVGEKPLEIKQCKIMHCQQNALEKKYTNMLENSRVRSVYVFAVGEFQD